MESTVISHTDISRLAFRVATELDREDRMPARLFTESQHRVDQALESHRASCIARAVFAAARLAQQGIDQTFLMFRDVEHIPGINAHGQLLVPTDSATLWGIRIEGIRSVSANATRVAPLSRHVALRDYDLTVLGQGTPVTLQEPPHTKSRYVVLPFAEGLAEYQERFNIPNPETFAEAKATVDAIPVLEV